jgi:hypothetical protein
MFEQDPVFHITHNCTGTRWTIWREGRVGIISEHRSLVEARRAVDRLKAELENA